MVKLQLLLGAAGLTGAVICIGQLSAASVESNGVPSIDRLTPTLSEVRAGETAEGGAGAGLNGPDCVLSDVQSISNHGQVGGIYAYTLGSHTCNIGNQNMLWTNFGTPGLAMNAYRLHDGRLVQLGLSFVKTACCAAAGNGCGLACNGSGGSVLGAGCLDVYSSGWNSNQNRLAARSAINAWTGQFSNFNTGSGNAIYKRLQVHSDDLDSKTYPGALYFAEGVYVASDDAGTDRALNNASYKQVNISGTNSMSLTGPMYEYQPAIYAWRDHGFGIDNPDESVKIINVDVPDEGRFVVGSKATDLGDGNWRYDYAVFNLNSDRSGGSLHVPVPAGLKITNVGFHDVDYHSGEPYDNTDWTVTVDDSGVTWSSPETFQQNADSNAIRWGTMYNFWFEVNRGPEQADATLGLFKPHTPSEVDMTVFIPDQTPVDLCNEDLNGDDSVDVIDLLAVLGVWGDCVDCDEDLNGDGTVDVLDLLQLLGAWGPCS